jgi:hypothetical protein
MIGAAFLVTTLKYLVLVACAASWAYAAYHGTRFEMRLSTRDFHAIEALNHPSTLFRHDLPKRALESRQKTFRGLAVFFALGLCLLAILYFDRSGPVTSPFLFHNKLG